ncbi:MAG: UvrD-helicase domain-containing protein [Clostridia bacterium]|nr:UvrD-helicase domain-containing protein [Clostridia bacterium]
MSKQDNILTPQQSAAINERGRLIVSASAGSGKTFVMIERLVRYVQAGGDLENVLAVTFTKKAAAQMKEKLRKSLIKCAAECKSEERAHIKAQLGKIPSANISTIHSFCAYLLRTHFYSLDIDGSFDIVSEDNGAENQLIARAMESLFDRLYKDGNPYFMLVLSCYTKRRSDGTLKKQLAQSYADIRMYADYQDRLKNTGEIYTKQGFDEICKKLAGFRREQCARVRAELYDFMDGFVISEKPELFKKIAGQIADNLVVAEGSGDIFEELPKFATTNKITGHTEEDIAASAAFGKMKEKAKDAYEMFNKLSGYETELKNFLKSGELAVAYSELLLQFDQEYTAIKREEGKLDYGDLEHYALKILSDEGVKNEVRSGFKQVFVDEYQDVNPVQEEIISAVGGENLFLVGDVKQAIYGFRGSKSMYFTEQVKEFSRTEGKARSLSFNFRSAPKVISTVNALFSKLMRTDSCGIDYAADGVMQSGGGYPQDSGGVTLHIFGKEEKVKNEQQGVYSVAEACGKELPPSREGLAVLDIIERELNSTVYDLDLKAYRPVTAGDICILTRMNANESAAGIARTLAMAGYPVSGAQSGNVCDTPECKQIIDILSYIDNGEQDIPMASAMLSPAGGFTEEELAGIKITYGGEKGLTFRDCCERYSKAFNNGIAQKLNAFYAKTAEYRRTDELFGAATVIDKILTDGGLEAVYTRSGGGKLKNVRRLAEEAVTPEGELSCRAFLDKLKAGGYKVKLAQGGGGDSIKIMTMHASKGLEFPVVILADVCRSFKGREGDGIPIDGEYGFAHKAYDTQKRVYASTVLNRLQKLKLSAEDVKNEMNLLYVACTRAKFRLHILASENVPFSRYGVNDASDYAHMLDFSLIDTEYMQPQPAQEAADEVTLIGKADGDMLKELRQRYKAPYAYADSIDLPVKSSASAILKMNEENYYARHELFPEAEGDTGAERGTAYHRFLQLCDFTVKDKEGIKKELEYYVNNGLITAEQRELLNEDNLEKILCMNVFTRTDGKQLYREQEFLCSLPADSFMATAATDGVMVQGAIDLLCVGGGRCDIIDYKYSKKNDEAIVKTYAPQLNLYRLAAEKITGIPCDRITTTIVNIYTLHEIPLIKT